MQVLSAVVLALLLAGCAVELVLLWEDSSKQASDPTAREGLVIYTKHGGVRGHRVPGSPSVQAAYLGIPYAASPVGPLRWQPPAAPHPWAPLVLPGNVSGPGCIGQATPGVSLASMDEDCLRLDVYTPSKGPFRRPHPVMVFLHGGDLVEGSAVSVQSGFGAVANVTRLPAVSVVVNYRLAVLGFLSVDAIAQADVRGVGGNYGFLDSVAALQWVQENIEAFGGDPARVTVYGQSSGGSLALALVASPMASGLFQTAVSMSGSPRLSSTTLEARRSWHREVVARTRCSQVATAQLFACLHSLGKAELVEAMPPDWDSNAFSFAAFSPSFRYAPLLLIDNTSALPSDYLSLYRHPHPRSPLGQGATLVIGATREEADFSPGKDVRGWTEQQMRTFTQERLRPSFNASFVSKVETAYGLSAEQRMASLDLQQVYAQIVSDATIFCPSLVLADAFAEGRRQRRSGRIFVYLTRQCPGDPAGFCPLKPFQSIPGYCPHFAFHAIDLFALFAPNWNVVARSPGAGYNSSRTDLQYESLILERLAELSATGAVSAWREYRSASSTSEHYSVVDLVAPGERNVRDLRRQQCELWKPLYAKLGLIN